MRKPKPKTNAQRQAAWRARRKAKLAHVTTLEAQLARATRKTAKAKTLAGVLANLIEFNRTLRGQHHAELADQEDAGFEVPPALVDQLWGERLLDELRASGPEIDRRELIDLIDSLNALNLAWWDSLPDSEKSFTVRL